MRLLLDTHLLLWAAARPTMMSDEADALVEHPENLWHFSAASSWEVAIERALGRPDFRTDPAVRRAGLLANGYVELPIEARHCLPLGSLPALHGDPFDRLLVAQAQVEGLTLVTCDEKVAKYPGSIRLV